MVLILDNHGDEGSLYDDEEYLHGEELDEDAAADYDDEYAEEEDGESDYSHEVHLPLALCWIFLVALEEGSEHRAGYFMD